MKPAENIEDIYRASFEHTVGFYNRHQEIFLAFEQKFGVNIWWLVHFRVYFFLRDFMLRNAEAVSENDSTKTASSGLVQKPSVGSFVLKTLKELTLMFVSYRKPKKLKGALLLTEPFRSDEGIFGQLENEFNCISNREILNPKKETPSFAKFRSQKLSVDYLIIDSLLSVGCVGKIFKFNKELNTLFADLASGDKTSEDDAILLQLKQSRFSLLIYYLRYLAFEKAFSASALSAVLMQDENSPQQKVIQYAARKHGVRVFAYQHGNIHRWNPAYNYSSYQQKPTLPDATFVWGEHSKEMLTSWGGYPEESVVVTGRIKPLKEKRTKNPILDQNKKIILYASQPLPDAQLRSQYLNDVILAAKEFENEYQLVIRPHPAEMDDNYFFSAAKAAGYSDLILDRQTDLTTHMEICDVLITSFSTVGTEFIPFYKPLLVLDYPKEDLMGWVAQGVGIQITERSELKEALRSDVEVQKLKYDQFVQRHFFQLDGKADQRIKDHINSQISS